MIDWSNFINSAYITAGIATIALLLMLIFLRLNHKTPKKR